MHGKFMIFKLPLCIAVIILFTVCLAHADTTPPELIDLSFSPTVIDCSGSDQTVTVLFTITDDLSGLTEGGSASYATFYSPSGQQYRHASFLASNLISGTVQDGIFQTDCVFPQYSETGTWHITTVRLIDRVGNWRDYLPEDLADIGIPTELTVSSLPGQLPAADAGPDQVVLNSVTLDGSGSSDPDGSIVSWEWQLHHAQNAAYDKTASGQAPTLEDLAAGFYSVELTVTDSQGLTATDAMMLAVEGSLAGDANRNGQVDIADIILILQIMTQLRQ